MEKPTLSPQSNRLLEICQGVLEGQCSPDELWDLLDEMRSGLDKARSDFMEQVQKQGESYIEKMQTEMDMVLASFDNYQTGLDHITGYFQTNNAGTLGEGMEMIIRATNEILDTLTVYEAKSLQVGPTSFPILNMLILLADGFKANTVAEDEFRFMIYNAGLFFQKLLEETDNFSGTEGLAAIEILKEGYNKFLDGLEKMDEAAKVRNELMLDDALMLIQESQELIKQGYSKYNDEVFYDGPTDSPITNLVINTLKMVKDGKVPKELLVENLEIFQEHMDTLRTDVLGASFSARENEEITSEIKNTVLAMDLADEACDLIRTYIQTGNAAVTETAVQKLKESTEILKKSKEVFDDIGERENKVSCMRCGAPNEPANNTCVKCGAIMAKIPGKEAASTFTMGEAGESMVDDEDFVMTENLYTLFKAIERYINGKIDFYEFSGTLDWMENLLNQNLEQSGNLPVINPEVFPDKDKEVLTKYKSIVDETLGLLQEGINEFLDALIEMRQAGVDNDMSHIRDGVDGVIEAAKKIQQVEKVSETVTRELQESEVQAAMAGSMEESASFSEDDSSGDDESLEETDDAADEDAFIPSGG